MIAYIVAACFYGPDVGWDLRNYHFYDGFILLHGGFDRHFFPAQIQSWFNPMLDAGLVLMIEHLPPVLVTGVIALLQSLNIPLLFIILDRALQQTLAGATRTESLLIKGAAMLIGITGAMTLSELGSSFGDAITSLPLLASLAALGQAFSPPTTKRDSSYRWFAVAGFMAGLAFGLKLATAVYAPGFLLLFACLKKSPHTIVLSFTAFACACVFGAMITDGFWLWKIGNLTGNPVFPLLNGWFHSPWFEPINKTLDDRFMAKSFLDGILFPFATALGNHPGAEVYFTDARFVVIVVLLPVLFLRRSRDFAAALLVFFLAGYATWVSIAGIERYIVPLEMLSGIIIVSIISLVVKGAPRVAVVLMLTLMLLITTSIPDWHNRAGWPDIGSDGNWFRVAVPETLQKPEAMFLILGDDPMSYVIPFFRQDARFVRMEGNLKPSSSTWLYQARAEAISRHNGPFFTFGRSPLDASQATLLATYGLRQKAGNCIPLETNVDVFYACPLEPVGSNDVR